MTPCSARISRRREAGEAMGELRDFVAGVLERRGAAVEPVAADGLEVLAPEPLRRAMGWPELARLRFGSGATDQAIRIGLEGDWLDRFGALLGEQGRWAERQLALTGRALAAPGDAERILDRALDLPNAVWRFQGVDRDLHPLPAAGLPLQRAVRREARGADLARVQPGNRRRRRRNAGATAARSVAGSLLASSRAGRACCGRAGVAGRLARSEGPPTARPSGPAGPGAVPACHAAASRARPQSGARLSR